MKGIKSLEDLLRWVNDKEHLYAGYYGIGIERLNIKINELISYKKKGQQIKAKLLVGEKINNEEN